MKILAFIQARMASSRLPGKVLMPVLGRPMIEWQLERLKQSKKITRIAILTSTSSGDDAMADYCKKSHTECFRGSETDVLARFHEAASKYLSAEERKDAIIIRLTGDCPLIDPGMIDDALEQFRTKSSQGCRYYGYPTDLPDGMDFELFTFEALDEAFRNSTDPFEKEHVTPFIWRNPDRFGVQWYKKSGITSGLRFSVDYPEDVALVETLLQYQQDAGCLLGAKEISDLISENPNLTDLNSKIIKNEGLIKSALATSGFKVQYQGVSLTKYGVCWTEKRIPEDAFIKWCLSMGINAWLVDQDIESKMQALLKECAIFTENRKPPNWVTIFSEEELKTTAKSNATDDGLFLKTTDYKVLASMLTYLCQTRFTS